jgi:hypothetical protein
MAPAVRIGLRTSTLTLGASAWILRGNRMVNSGMKPMKAPAWATT